MFSKVQRTKIYIFIKFISINNYNSIIEKKNNYKFLM